MDIQILKAQQVDFENRKTALLEIFDKFSNAFIKAIQEFVDKALAENINSVKGMNTSPKATGYRLYECKLNHLNVTLVVSNYVHKRDKHNLSSKIFVYISSSKDSSPFVEIEVYGDETGRYSYNIYQFPENERSTYDTGTSATEEDGKRAAESLINFFYNITFIWADRPKLGDVINNNGNVLGFQVHK